MSRLGQIASETRLYPLWVLLGAAAILFLRLGSYGFWEPSEVQVADRANEIAHPALGEVATADKPAPSPPPRRQTRSELSEELIAKAIQSAGRSEATSRAPLALLALLTVLCTYFIGLRVGGPRAGLISAAIVIGFPALLMHGRHLTSEIGSAAGSALVVLGLLGLLSRRGFGFRREPSSSLALLYPIDALLVIAGTLLAYRAAGMLLGVLPPFGAVGVAAAIFVASKAGAKVDRARLAIGAAIGVVGAIAAFAIFFASVFDVAGPVEDASVVEARGQAGDAPAVKAPAAPANDGYWFLAGRDLEIESDYQPALAGLWRKNGDRRVGFSTSLENIAVGTFPWIAIIPIAVLALLIGSGRERNAARTVIALWALAAYVTGAIFARKVGVAMYPAWAALAVAGGVWLADVFDPDRKNRESLAADEDEGSGPLPLAAFFIVCAVVVVGKDILALPEKLTELNLTSAKLEFPVGIRLHFVWIVVGCAAILALATALATRDLEPAAGGGRLAKIVSTFRRTAQRGGLVAGLALGLLGALVFTQGLTPELSKKLSSKNILGVYQDLRAEGDALGIMGNAGGASYYAGTEFERIRGRSQLLQFLERPERVFALAPASERCPLNKAARKQALPYYVVDDSSAQYLLFSNQLKDGEQDVNPLKKVFFSEPPTDIRKPLAWNLDDRVELIGVSMPDTVRKGATFTMKLYFKVNKAISRNWKIFVHFDKGIKINADHDPIGGTCGTAYWLPGDYVVDEHQVTAGSRTSPSGAYSAWAGFFVGSGGNFTNMKVLTPGADEDDRIPIGTLTLK